MQPTGNISYRDSGVDTNKGQEFVHSIASSVQKTYNHLVVTDQAGFAGLLDISFLKDYKKPLLVSSTDGVGTKIHLARLFDTHDTIGIDLVGMCVNDLLATGAKPLQFLDYIACGKLDAKKMQKIVYGISEGCVLADCVLAGGETAEHPNTMHPDEYDLAGFVNGVVEADARIDPAYVKEGDVLIALPSSGVHANGMSLIRKLFLKDGLHLGADKSLNDFLLNEILLKPTIIYEKILRPIIQKYTNASIHGIAHITGGGFFENIPRILPQNLSAHIDLGSYELPELFRKIQQKGVAGQEMYHVFNMGIGMLLAVQKDQASSILDDLNEEWHKSKQTAGPKPWIAGEVIAQTQNAPKVILK